MRRSHDGTAAAVELVLWLLMYLLFLFIMEGPTLWITEEVKSHQDTKEQIERLELELDEVKERLRSAHGFPSSE